MEKAVRFEGKVDRGWLVAGALVALLCAVSFIPTFVFATRGGDSDWLVFATAGGACAAVLIALEAFLLAPFWRSYIELRDEGMLVAFGVRTRALDYRFVTGVRPKRDALITGGWAGSLQGVMVENDVEDFMVSVRDEGRFVSELARRCPRIAQ